MVFLYKSTLKMILNVVNMIHAIYSKFSEIIQLIFLMDSAKNKVFTDNLTIQWAGNHRNWTESVCFT